jgi:outer membrane protein
VLLGRGADDALELVPPSDAELVADDDLLDLGRLQQEAQAQHPRILAAQARVAAARARQDGVQAASKGALVLQANGGPARVKGDVAVASTTQSLGLTWSMPIFDGASTDARRRDALAGLEAERAALDEARRQVDLELWQQAQALRGERDNLQAVDLALQTAREALRVASARYREGIGSFPDLLATQNALAAAQAQRQQARASLLLARVRLAAAVGRLLPG